MLEGLAREEQLCCLLCRRSLSDELRERIRDLVSDDFDWNRFVALVTAHRILPLASRHLKETASDLIPADISLTLRANALAMSKRSEMMAEELSRVLALLEDSGIRAVPMKGPVLMERLWGDRRLGDSMDLDVLVSQADHEKATQVLTNEGYVPRAEAPAVPESFAKGGGPVVLVKDHPTGLQLIIDLNHTGSEEILTGCMITSDGLWGQLEMTAFMGMQSWTLSDEWNISYLALHVLRHWFTQLHWVAELHNFIHERPNIWPDALECANEAGVHREVAFARRICDLILSEESVSRDQLPAFERQLAEAPFRDHPPEWSWQRLQWACRTGVLEKTVFLLAWPFQPSWIDFQTYPLPRRWHWLYFFLRPFRLARTYIPLAVRSFGRKQRKTPDGTATGDAKPSE